MITASLCIALGACAAPSPTAPIPQQAVPEGGPIFIDAPTFAMPSVITDGPERVALLTDQLDNLVTLVPLSDDELDEVDAIEDALAAFTAGRATNTLEDLEGRYGTLENRVFARVR